VTNTALKFYDPPYLEREALFPNYELLNINLKGYDYSVLDVFYKFVEKLCDSLKIEVVEAYAMPARKFKIKTYQQFSSNLDREYELNTYHRIIRIKSLKSTLAPILFESIQMNLPEGVQLNITAPNKEEEEFRYVPDIELNELKEQLEDISRKPKSEAENVVAAATSTPTSTTPAAKQKPK
jgi:large subunit ribosomal protein L48